jgi:homocysteine S-methyltransferase
MSYRGALPQLDGSVLATDGGMETWLLFDEGFELPCFASFPLLDTERGRAALARYYEPYLDVARRHGIGFVIEAATWRASPNWGTQLGYPPEALADVNRRAVGFVAEIRERERAPQRPMPISAPIGPESDAYSPEQRLTRSAAERYHGWQARVLAGTEADLVTGLTLTYVDEAVGIARASAEAGIPAAISFTVETDGRLPSGQPLDEAIEETDDGAEGTVAYYMVNCAHPTHFLDVLGNSGPWERLLGIRTNASRKSHAELDESTGLDAGDPDELAEGYLAIRERLPHLTVLGGCCGTDHRHVATVVGAWLGA